MLPPDLPTCPSILYCSTSHFSFRLRGFLHYLHPLPHLCLYTLSIPMSTETHPALAPRPARLDTNGANACSLFRDFPRLATPGALCCPKGYINQTLFRVSGVGTPGALLVFRCIEWLDPFNVNESFGVKERNDHGLLLQSALHCIPGPGGLCVLPLRTLMLVRFALRVIGEHPTLINKLQSCSGNLNLSLSFHECQCNNPLETVFDHLRESWEQTWHRLCGASDLQSKFCLQCQYLATPTASNIILTDTLQSCITNHSTSSLFPCVQAIFRAPNLVHLQCFHFCQKIY